MGFQPYLVHEDVIKQVTEQHPRMKWSGCFSSTIKAEIGVCNDLENKSAQSTDTPQEKPWCHSTALPNFAEDVANNKVMEPYD